MLKNNRLRFVARVAVLLVHAAVGPVAADDAPDFVHDTQSDQGTMSPRLDALWAGDLFADSSRFYVAPIVGPSWSTAGLVGENLNSNLFTAGGALGVALPNRFGQVRLEVESRYRDGFRQSDELDGFIASYVTGDNWSVLLNSWLDIRVTNNVGFYAGGGVGGGGRSTQVSASASEDGLRVSGNARSTAFAWQAGGGVIYALSDRVTFDVGYRFYGLADATLPVTLFVEDFPADTIPLDSSFSASELLFTLRIYEPFRGWKR